MKEWALKYNNVVYHPNSNHIIMNVKVSLFVKFLRQKR